MTMISELLIARHGEAECNIHGIVGGERGCTGLTARGRFQSELLARRLLAEHTNEPFDVVYTTPRRRVVETARIITSALEVEPIIDPELRGIDHGSADGTSWRAVKDSFGGPPQFHPQRSYATGGESWEQYLQRVTNALDRILAGHPEHRILVLAHGETIEAANTHLLGLPAGTSRHLRFTTTHTGLTRWQHHLNRLGQATWTLATHNDTTHLAPVTP
ncbi:histidine phosphatase family protein [Nocardia takedensis]|uniref:histidine phosphatase family protein n=1 Tax=Nocardia takedensis TaxID=259390 RepID=UPI0002E0337E|nr:histidine phosphatase family protein [Nocardia takedensis]